MPGSHVTAFSFFSFNAFSFSKARWGSYGSSSFSLRLKRISGSNDALIAPSSIKFLLSVLAISEVVCPSFNDVIVVSNTCLAIPIALLISPIS